MQKSESIALLAAALVKAQGQIKGAVKDSTNPFFKSSYADLGSVWAACKEALQANGLAVVQAPIATEAGIGVETMLLHTSGEWLSEVLVLPVAKHDAQGGGSCISYARRYALAAFVGVCPEDDDGNAAADSSANLLKQGLALLEPASKQGLDSLKKAWDGIPRDMRLACKGDLERLKKAAANGKPVAA